MYLVIKVIYLDLIILDSVSHRERFHENQFYCVVIHNKRYYLSLETFVVIIKIGEK